MAEPLTTLLCLQFYLFGLLIVTAYLKMLVLLCMAPFLAAPDFSKAFKQDVDASMIGAEAVLLQENVNGIHHLVCYFSRKFNKCQAKYSIEKGNHSFTDGTEIF